MQRVTKTFSTKSGQWDSAITLTIEFLFQCEDVPEDILGWALSERTIALQRVLRNMSQEEIDEAFPGGKGTIAATDCGKKIETKAAKIAELKRLMAQLGVEDPSDIEAL